MFYDQPKIDNPERIGAGEDFRSRQIRALQ